MRRIAEPLTIGRAFLLFSFISFIGKSSELINEAIIRDEKYISADISCGTVEGMREEADEAFVFRGIPYSIPRVGENRWLPSQLIENIDDCWKGKFKAYNSTPPPCLQNYGNASIGGSEDCLTLDVMTPHVRYNNPLPVVVLIGTESMSGDSPSNLLPSARHARNEKVIFVRPNFRVGVFGFLTLEILSERARSRTSGNYALGDILTVLKWVKLNIHHFGGNPKNVVLLGHRAGATIVSALVTSRQAKKLFAKAWVTSGAAIFPTKSLYESQRDNVGYLLHTNCDTHVCLTCRDPDELLEMVPITWRRDWPDLPTIPQTEYPFEIDTTPKHEALALDGEILNNHPAEDWNTGPPNMVIGTTAHAGHSEKLFLKNKEWTPELVREHIQNSIIGYLGLVDIVLKRYNATYQGLVSMISDIRITCPLYRIAQAQPFVPFYVVTQTSGDLNLVGVDDDVQAILGWYTPITREQASYLYLMQRMFYHYVFHGEIKQFKVRQRVLDIGNVVSSIENYPNCDFWIKNGFVPEFGRVN